jgi:phage-related protein
MDLKRASARTQKIVTGALGGYYVVVSDEYGKTVAEYHLNDAPDLETARNVWRWNKDGLGFSSTGYNGTYKMLLTGDGSWTGNF